MPKNSLYLSAFLIFFSGTLTQATLPGTAPTDPSKDASAKCIQDCMDRTGGDSEGGVSCEQVCGIATNIPETMSQGTVDTNPQVIPPTLPDTTLKD